MADMESEVESGDESYPAPNRNGEKEGGSFPGEDVVGISTPTESRRCRNSFPNVWAIR